MILQGERYVAAGMPGDGKSAAKISKHSALVSRRRCICITFI